MALDLQCVALPVEESAFHSFVTVGRNLDLEPEWPRLNDCVCLEEQKLRPDSGPGPLSRGFHSAKMLSGPQQPSGEGGIDLKLIYDLVCECCACEVNEITLTRF